MAKRTAESFDNGPSKLKSGERPLKVDNGNEEGNFEDEFEDEFDSEDEVLEAGVDGRPDDEQEVNESRGMWITPEALCEIALLHPKTRG